MHATFEVFLSLFKHGEHSFSFACLPPLSSFPTPRHSDCATRTCACSLYVQASVRAKLRAKLFQFATTQASATTIGTAVICLVLELATFFKYRRLRHGGGKASKRQYRADLRLLGKYLRGLNDHFASVRFFESNGMNFVTVIKSPEKNGNILRMAKSEISKIYQKIMQKKFRI